MDGSPLPFLIVALVALALCWSWMRAARARSVPLAVTRWPIERRAWVWAIAFALALAAWWPLWSAWPLVLSQAYLPGDAASHARVALDIARHGLPHGWAESYSGGFPFGPHYQSAALLISALLVRAGATASAATWIVGLGATLVVPALFVVTMRAARAPPGGALLGAVFLAWLSPVHVFVGGPAVMLSQGLVAQALGCAALVATAAAVLTRTRWPLAMLLGAFSMAAHAQLAVCALLAAAPTALLFGSPAIRRRFAFAAAGASVVAVAVYLPGARHFTVPFSWAKVPAFRIVGYGAERLGAWLIEGAMFDAGRAPILSACLWLAIAVVVVTLRSRASRAVLSLFVTTVVLSASGTMLSELGETGARIVEIYSPVRMLCLIPLAAAALISVAVAQVRSWFAVHGASGWHGGAVGAAMVTALWLLAPGRDSRASLTAWKHDVRAWQDDRCRRESWSGYDALTGALAAVDVGGGRFVVHKTDTRTPCPVRAGVELATDAPLGAGTGGPGSQLGILILAFESVAPERTAGWARAEAMGVRSVLHRRAVTLDGPWKRVAEAGETVLSVRQGGHDGVAVGCIDEEWSGADRAIRDALFDDLESEAPRALAPQSLVRLRAAEGPSGAASGTVQRRAVDRNGCDTRAAELRTLTATPGERRVAVTSPHPVDVVVRSTYLSTWQAHVDGQPAEPVLVAPGFFAVRVPAGSHEVVARIAPLPFYLHGLIAGFIALALLAWWEHRTSLDR